MKKNVLIVEDEPHILSILEIRLSEEPFDLHTLSNGLNVYEKVKELNPKLVLLDLILPGKNGHRVLQDLKSDPETRNVPVIICSARIDAESIAQTQALGADGYLIKPFELNDLMDIIFKYVN